MTKYEEICAAYAKARKEWEEHRQACRDFLSDLLQKLSDDLGVPRADLLLLPPNVEYDRREVCPVEEVLTYGADSAFHFGLAMRVRAAADNPMTEVLVLQVSISRNPGGFEMRLLGLNEPIRMPLALEETSKGHRVFLDLFAKRSISNYAERDQRFTELTDQSRTLMR